MKEKYTKPELLLSEFSSENILEDSSSIETVDDDNAFKSYSNLSDGRFLF